VTKPDIVLAGAAHHDRTARIDGRDAMGHSNPGTWSECFGGAAWNVAVNLAALGRKPMLHTILGDDGGKFEVAAASAGVELRAQHSDTATASYSAIVDRTGNLILAVADMEIYNEFSADCLDDVPAVIVDANLPEHAIATLLDKAPWTVALAVSPAKAVRLEPHFGKIDILFANASEVEALGGLNKLADRVSLIISSDGANPLRLIDHGEIEEFNVPDTEVTGDVVGAGDALAAGYLHHWLDHHTPTRGAQFAIACAQSILAVQGPARHDLLEAANECVTQ